MSEYSSIYHEQEGPELSAAQQLVQFAFEDYGATTEHEQHTAAAGFLTAISGIRYAPESRIAWSEKNDIVRSLHLGIALSEYDDQSILSVAFTLDYGTNRQIPDAVTVNIFTSYCDGVEDWQKYRGTTAVRYCIKSSEDVMVSIPEPDAGMKASHEDEIDQKMAEIDYRATEAENALLRLEYRLLEDGENLGRV